MEEGDADADSARDTDLREKLAVKYLAPDKKASAEFITKNPRCIVAGTVWAVRKFASSDRFDRPPQFHLVVVDEASQMLVSQACFAFQFLHPTQGTASFLCF